MRDRVVEAAQTLLASPADLGPRAKQGAFSDLVAAVIQTEYDRAPSYRRILSAGSLSRMEETWKWINDYLEEEDRKLVYDYGFIKAGKVSISTVILRKTTWCAELSSVELSGVVN
ncbi:hypothetical protein HED54_00160 [Ochrobactrum anthropi ATCC 49188]|nr:hypothetical protein [Brucella anthropi ATCC 49188]